MAKLFMPEKGGTALTVKEYVGIKLKNLTRSRD